MRLFVRVLRKIETSCEIRGVLTPFLGMYKMAASGSFFVTISCVIRGYHVYKEVWSPNIGEKFVCFDEEDKVHDSSAQFQRALPKLEGVSEL